MAPRYTSYPTAPQFRDSFGADDYHQHADYSNEHLLPRDLSIYIHIPFCSSLCYFCGCNKVVTQSSNKKVSDYLERLTREIVLRSQLFSDDRAVTQIHFGGGTPNFLSLAQLAGILDQIAMQFNLELHNSLDISIEIDPRTVSPEEIDQLAELGFNRFSIGVQDFCPDVQPEVNRIQPRAQTLEIIQAALRNSSCVNVDLITGLPRQTPEDFKQTLLDVIDSGVSRVAAYNFAYLPQHIKTQRRIDRSLLPDAQAHLDIAKITRETLTNAGFMHIGMDHYARPDDPLAIAFKQNTLQRNFQGYTTHQETDLVGIGASAISHFESAYAQNVTHLSLYNESIDTHSLPVIKGIELTDDDRIRAGMIQQIMCRSTIDLSQNVSRYINRLNQLNLAEYFNSELKELNRFIDDEMIVPTAKGFDITDLGRYFMRPIATVFDRYLPKESNLNERVVTFSRTI